MTDRSERFTLPLIAVALVALPFGLSALGLTLTSATDVVVFAVACMGLNILVGQTGLVSFGHGAFFGLGAYAAAIGQRTFFPGTLLPPILFALAFVAVAALLLGLLILRRRGVYFSLLTLALSALSFTVAFRWTALTGGESGYGGVERTRFLGLDLDAAWTWYGLVAVTAFAVAFGLARFRRSPVGTVLEAIRENEQRARFLGYPTQRYKLLAFTVSATVTGLAGVLSVFTHRFASAEPLGTAFSGELLAMVVIGGMRGFAGPAIGALFFILFREMLSIWTADWLFWFGLLFVGFILFSPDGLVGIGRRVYRMVRPPATEDAAMAGRKAGLPENLPAFLRPDGAIDGVILAARGIAKRFGGLKAVDGVTIAVRDRTLHALIGPNGAGKTTAFNLISGMYKPETARSPSPTGRSPASPRSGSARPASAARSRSPTSFRPSPSRTTSGSPCRGAAPAGSTRGATPVPTGKRPPETAEILRWLGLAGLERAEAGSLSYGGQRLLDMGVALATKPRMLLLDEPLAGLAAAERTRIGDIIKRVSTEVPVLMVEHDIDRVFQIADAVTVMNEGTVLVDGTVEDARTSPKVQEVYIGSGTAAMAAVPARAPPSRRCCSRSRTSIPSTARATSSRASPSTCRPTRSWRSSAATAPASRPASRPSPGWRPTPPDISSSGPTSSTAARRRRSRGPASATCRRGAGSSPG